MLERRDELVQLYIELDAYVRSDSNALYRFFDSVLLTAELWNPEKNLKARKEREHLKEVNGQIAVTAYKLAALLDQRSDFGNTSCFSSDTHYCVCETLEAAAKSNASFDGFVKDKFRQLYRQYDLKYWPTLSDFIYELAQDADNAKISTSNSVTAAATSGSRNSLKGYLRALETHFEGNSPASLVSLPSIDELSDESMASLLNCVLDLHPDDMKDASYMKRFRQGERQCLQQPR